MSVLAHGVGSRTGLPIPLGLALYGAGAAILLGFAVLLLFWRSPQLGDEHSGRPLPAGLQRFLDSPAWHRSLQTVALAVTGLVVAVAFRGQAEPSENLASWALYVTFWVGLVPAGLLLGPLWRTANPLRLLHRLLRPVLPDAPGAERLPASACGRRRRP